MADYGTILNDMASEMGVSSVPVRDDPEPDSYASTDGSSIFVNAGFMAKVMSSSGEGGVRFVLAHELGHIVNGMERGGHDGEFAADQFAARAVATMGDEVNSISGVMSYLPNNSSESHPGANSRESAAKTVFQTEANALALRQRLKKRKKHAYGRTKLNKNKASNKSSKGRGRDNK